MARCAGCVRSFEVGVAAWCSCCNTNDTSGCENITYQRYGECDLEHFDEFCGQPQMQVQPIFNEMMNSSNCSVIDSANSAIDNSDTVIGIVMGLIAIILIFGCLFGYFWLKNGSLG